MVKWMNALTEKSNYSFNTTYIEKKINSCLLLRINTGQNYLQSG